MARIHTFLSKDSGVVGLCVAFLAMYCLLALPLSGYFYDRAVYFLVFIFCIFRLGGLAELFHLRAAFILLVALLVVNVAISELPAKSLKGALNLLRAFSYIVGGYFATALLTTENQLKVLRYLTISFFLFFSVSACSALFVPAPINIISALYQGAFVLWGNPHNLINTVSILGLMCAVSICFESGFSWKCLSVFIIVPLLWLQYEFRLEGSYLGLAASIGAGVFVFFKGRVLCFYLMALAVFGCAFIYIHINFDLQGINQVLELSGFGSRPALFQETWDLWLSRPLLGYGLNTYKYLPEIVVGKVHPYPHNIYLESLFSLGIIGTFLFLFSWFLIFSKVKLQEIKTSPFPLVGLLVFVYFSVKGLTDMGVTHIQPMGVLFMSLGLMLGAGKKLIIHNDPVNLCCSNRK